MRDANPAAGESGASERERQMRHHHRSALPSFNSLPSPPFFFPIREPLGRLACIRTCTFCFAETERDFAARYLRWIKLTSIRELIETKYSRTEPFGVRCLARAGGGQMKTGDEGCRETREQAREQARERVHEMLQPASELCA